ncbi:hypothetical protein DL95DRAFT_505896 [Leptodontidium sp. 2 PMI_412]|nr:hypothetical protein DL95DRAFT_505896 [Leptodontidium sp. 2 PMI_412]
MAKSSKNKPAALTSPKSPEGNTKAATNPAQETKPVLLEATERVVTSDLPNNSKSARAAEIASLTAQLSKKISEYNQLRGEKITEVDRLTRKLNTEISAHNRTEQKLKERTSALSKVDNLNKDMQAVNKRMKAKTEKAVIRQQEELKRAQKMVWNFVTALDRGWDQKLRAERAERELEVERSISVVLAFVGFVCLLLGLWSYSMYHD